VTGQSEVRLQKFLSQAGVASRRAAEELITAGRVRVNGSVVKELGVRVDPRTAIVEVDGERIRPATRRWVAFHKPRGYVSTRHDTHGQRTVYSLLPDELQGLFYVGRLDRESEGLMLFTNDGDAAHRLLHPSFRVERVYEVHLAAEPGARERKILLQGIELEDGLARAINLRRLKPTKMGRTRVAISLMEGRKREVRRMFEAIGHPVIRLRRMRYGPIELGDLPPGGWRDLHRDEIAALERPVPPPPQRRGPHKSTRGAQSGSRGHHKGPGGPRKGGRGPRPDEPRGTGGRTPGDDPRPAPRRPGGRHR